MEEKLQNILDFFKGITMDEETHTYYLNDFSLEGSVSTRTKKYVEKVNFYEISLNIDRKLGLPEGTTSQRWKYKSEQACALGTRVHYFGEIYPFHRNIEPTDGFERAVKKFWDDLPNHILPVVMELKMYHKEKGYPGTMDILLYNTKTDKFILADYKTNEKMHENFDGKTLLAPFEDLLETNLNKYKLQLSEYQILFEQTGYEVEERVIIWLKESGEYELYPCEDLTEKLLNS